MRHEPKWERKGWGRVFHLFASPTAAVSYLEFNENTKCSRHFHQNRVNLFAILSGIVVIEILDDTGKTVTDAKILRKNDTFEVAPGVVHRFRVLKSGRMIEVYYPPDVDIHDIERLDVGGVDDEVQELYLT